MQCLLWTVDRSKGCLKFCDTHPIEFFLSFVPVSHTAQQKLFDGFAHALAAARDHHHLHDGSLELGQFGGRQVRGGAARSGRRCGGRRGRCSAERRRRRVHMHLLRVGGGRAGAGVGGLEQQTAGAEDAPRLVRVALHHVTGRRHGGRFVVEQRTELHPTAKQEAERQLTVLT